MVTFCLSDQSVFCLLMQVNYYMFLRPNFSFATALICLSMGTMPVDSDYSLQVNGKSNYKSLLAIHLTDWVRRKKDTHTSTSLVDWREMKSCSLRFRLFSDVEEIRIFLFEGMRVFAESPLPFWLRCNLTSVRPWVICAAVGWNSFFLYARWPGIIFVVKSTVFYYNSDGKNVKH